MFTLLTSSVVAYALARNIHRPFFKGVFFYLLAALFIPFPIIMLPLVKQTAILGLDNQAGMIILYTIYGLSLNIFIYTAYIRSIPIELEEAARMDGASTWRVFRSVIFPLLMPMNATVGILTCVWAWNDFIMPLVVLTEPSGAHAAAGAVRVPGAVQHRLHGRVRVVPDGDGAAADRLHLLAALGHLRRHARVDQVANGRPGMLRVRSAKTRAAPRAGSARDRIGTHSALRAFSPPG